MSTAVARVIVLSGAMLALSLPAAAQQTPAPSQPLLDAQPGAAVFSHASGLGISESTRRLLVDSRRRELSNRNVPIVSGRRTRKGRGALIGFVAGLGLALGNKAYWCQARWDADSCANASLGFLLYPGAGTLLGAGIGSLIKRDP